MPTTLAGGCSSSHCRLRPRPLQRPPFPPRASNPHLQHGRAFGPPSTATVDGHPVSPTPEQTQGRDPETRSWQVGAAPITLPPSLPLGLSPSQVTITAFYVRTLYKSVVYFIF